MAATIMSTGQITIVDLTDQRTSSFYLTANASKIQVYDKSTNTYSPDYKNNKVTVTPSFFYGNQDCTDQLTNSNLTYTVNGTTVSQFDSADDISNKDYAQVGHLLYIQTNIDNSGALYVVAKISKNGATDPETGLSNQDIIQATIEFARVDTGADGTGITNVTTQYGVSAAQDEQPTSWVDSADKVALGTTNKYLWIKQTTTFSDGSTKEQIYIAGTYGETGETGAAGRSVFSITEEYYISDSKTSPIGGSWRTDPPTSVEVNEYLWTRTEIIYTESNGTTTTEYVPSEDGKCDTTWEVAVDKVTEATNALNTLNQSYKDLKEDLQNQIDDAIDTWFGKEDPTTSNEPASTWTTEEVRTQHSGDLYYNTATGAAFRYVKEDGVWQWKQITDEALSSAVASIESLRTVVDDKVTIYYGDKYPESAEIDDLWIQGTDGDSYKCETAYDSSTTLDSTNWGTYWTLANSAVRKVDVEFARNQDPSSIDANSVTWQTTSPQWEEGWYIWQRTHIYDGSGNTLSTSEPVCITSASRSIKTVTNYYKRTTTNSAPSVSADDWSTTPTAPDADNPYLWNYEKVEYTYGDPSTTDPALIGMYSADGDAGRGIERITEWYLVSADKEDVTFEIGEDGTPTAGSGWYDTVQTTDDAHPYLWNAEVIQYNKAPIYEASEPQVIGYRGVGVKSITTYYQVNNSTTVPVNTSLDGWESTYEDAGAVSASAQYMWAFTKTIYTDGSISNTNPVIIATYAPAGKDAVYAIVESDSHIVFSDTQTADITLTATLYVGGVASTPNSYTWSSIPGTVSGTAQTLKVSRDMVTNIRTFICTMEYGGKNYSDRITISDKTDPIWCDITSSNGDKFTNGNVSTILTANLYHSQKGKLGDEALAKYYFNWKKYDKEGAEQPFTPSYAEGAMGMTVNDVGYKNKITIVPADVDSKAIFTCEVTTEAPSAGTT